jgi:hypothetical protein
MNPGCVNDAAMSKNGKTRLKYCSIKCRNTHNSIKGSEKRKQTCLERYGTTTNLAHSDTKEKIKNTVKERYGVEHIMHYSETKERLQKTKLERYNDPTFNNRKKFKETISNWNELKKQIINDKRKATINEKYGVNFITQSEQMKNKSKLTNLIRYNVENAAKSDIVKNKIKNTMLEKYGKHYQQKHIPDEVLDKLNNINFLIENKDKSLVEIASQLGVSFYTVDAYYNKYGIVRTFSGYNQSLAEKELKRFIEDNGFKTEIGNRTVLLGKEIDIYIPEKLLGIEYHGLYWHSQLKQPDKHYHFNKMKEAEKNNIRLIQITDYEWMNFKQIVKSRILTLLGKSTKLYARCCQIKDITSKEADEFLNRTHIQGSCISSIRLGLFHENKLVAVMTFGKSRFNKKYEYELLRYASELETVVVGGASKLFKYFLKTYSPSSVITYCDLRWNTGNMYNKLGFKYEKETGPNYWYTKYYNTFESRIHYQKHKLKNILSVYNESLSEWENMKNNGYDRFWDCGNKVFVWNTKKIG